MVSNQVVHETLDGETVIINLETGTYYSLEGSGAELWPLIVQGEPAEAVVDAVVAEHGGEPAATLAAVLAFLHRLFDEGLLTERPREVGEAAGSLGTFVSPKLTSYDDLQEHLLLDPIHDVERGAGWPAAASS